MNTDGVANVLAALKKLPTIRRFVATSTQFVVGPGPFPAHDLDLRPHTVYGESKVIGEQLVRKAELACTWSIIRPTNVWGPWHSRILARLEAWPLRPSGRRPCHAVLRLRRKCC
jgi:nucleoside-diphosphate-sugar epimerase